MVLQDISTGYFYTFFLIDGQQQITRIDDDYLGPVEKPIIVDDDLNYGSWELILENENLGLRATTELATPNLYQDQLNFLTFWELKVNQQQIYWIEILSTGLGRIVYYSSGKISKLISLNCPIPKDLVIHISTGGFTVMEKHYVGEIGSIILLNTEQDLSSAVSVKVKLTKPDGTILTLDASTYAIDNKRYYVKYTTKLGDLDVPGKYQIQPYVAFINWQGHGKTEEFRVYPLFT